MQKNNHHTVSRKSRYQSHTVLDTSQCTALTKLSLNVRDGSDKETRYVQYADRGVHATVVYSTLKYRYVCALHHHYILQHLMEILLHWLLLRLSPGHTWTGLKVSYIYIFHMYSTPVLLLVGTECACKCAKPAGIQKPGGMCSYG